MYEIRQTIGFQKWLGRLPDRNAKSRLVPGRLVLLLAGGDKNSQRADIARARALIQRLVTDI